MFGSSRIAAERIKKTTPKENEIQECNKRAEACGVERNQMFFKCVTSSNQEHKACLKNATEFYERCVNNALAAAYNGTVYNPKF
jgi:hypothetical protein